MAGLLLVWSQRSAHWVAPSHDIAIRLDKLEHIYRMRALLWSQRACGCTEQREQGGLLRRAHALPRDVRLHETAKIVAAHAYPPRPASIRLCTRSQPRRPAMPPTTEKMRS